MFLRLEEPQNTEYDGIVAVLNNAFNYFGMGNWKEKLIVFFFSDGAIAMMGELNGVATKQSVLSTQLKNCIKGHI